MSAEYAPVARAESDDDDDDVTASQPSISLQEMHGNSGGYVPPPLPAPIGESAASSAASSSALPMSPKPILRDKPLSATSAAVAEHVKSEGVRFERGTAGSEFTFKPREAIANVNTRLGSSDSTMAPAIDAAQLALRRPDALRSDVFNIELFQGNKHLSKEEWVKLSNFSSLNYHVIHNDLHKAEMNRLTAWHYKVDLMQRWLIAFCIGIITGLIAFLVHLGIEVIQESKLELKTYLVSVYGVHITAMMMYIVNCSIVLPGTLIVMYFATAANSSGIPFVKAYQNGIRIPQAFNLKTLGAKIIGVISSVSSNMPVGPEGPMIHIGGMIGGGVSQSRSKTLGCDLPFLRKFRNDHDRRDFIATGSACGVAAAFSAPIGGTLFAMEETSSFWSHTITWRTLFSCIVAAFTVDFVALHSTSATNSASVLSHVAIFQVQGATRATYFLWELIPFFILGIVGGVAGPAFIKINSLVTAFRMRNIGPRPLYRALEVLFFLLVWTVLVQYAPLLVECQDVPTSSKENWELNLLLQWTCPPGQYNGLASLFSISQTNALRALLKQQASTDFSLGTLVLFSLIYFFGASIIAGSTLVSGLMVPFLLIGAGYGRLAGQVVQTIVGTAWPIEVGLYAVIGATSFFGGVSRMTISLSVIMLEITGNTSLLLPIMITAMVSKWVGDNFSHPLYDILIGIQSIPFLEGEPAPIFNVLDVSQVMARDVKLFTSIVSVREVVTMLRTVEHDGFPVVESRKHPRLRGTILRLQLLVLLEAQVWKRRGGVGIGYSEFQTQMMNFKKSIDDMLFAEDDLDCTFDLTPFYNQCPFSVHSGFLLTLAFRLFRTMGLRHLPVVDERNYVVGMITRKDLLETVVEAKHDVLSSKLALGKGFRKVLSEITERAAHATSAQ